MAFGNYNLTTAKEHKANMKTRKAGEVFYGGYTPSKDSKGWKTSSSSPSPSSESSSNENRPEQSSAQTPALYDADQYKYYRSDFGSGTGAEAYKIDMDNYNNQHESIKKMPHVHAMFHPDWGRSQKTGGGNPVVAQDYSQPDEQWQRRAAKEAKFGKGSEGSPKGSAGLSKWS